MTTNTIEGRIKALNAMRAKADNLETYMRRMRLGAKPGLRAIWWRRMVYAFGYAEQKVEPMPAGMEDEFYSFLQGKAQVIAKEIRNEEARLSSVKVPAND